MKERRSSVTTEMIGTSRTITVSQKIRYEYSSPIADLYQLLKTFPPARHGSQYRRRWHLKINGVESQNTSVTFDEFANLTVETTAPIVEDIIEFAIEYEVEIPATFQTHYVTPDTRYLVATKLTKANSAIKQLAQGQSSHTITQLCSSIHHALVYEWGITNVGTTASQALTGGRGVCQDYAHIMLAACRYLGIAARYVSGHLPGEGGSHAWVEVLSRPSDDHCDRWIAQGWDPTHNRPTNADYLVVAVGRDYSDVAPFSGSYNGDGVTSTLTVDKKLDFV